MSNNFPTKENPQDCKKGCNQKIYLKNTGNKNSKTGNPIWLPYNLDDTVHNCQNKQNAAEVTSASNSKPTAELSSAIKTENREAKLAHIVESIQTILKELESLK